MKIMKIKSGDNVVVISGSYRGRSGKVTAALPRRHAVVVEGVNLKKRHERPRRANQKGQVVEKAMPIDVSNVALVEGGKPVRARFQMAGGKKVRVSRTTGKTV